MPQLKFKGIKQEEVAQISTEIVNEMSLIMDTPKDWFQVEYDPVVMFFDGREVPGEPMVQVWWFDRGQEVQNKAAKRLNEIICNLGYEYAVVSFHKFEKKDYYEDGTHF